MMAVNNVNRAAGNAPAQGVNRNLQNDSVSRNIQNQIIGDNRSFLRCMQSAPEPDRAAGNAVRSPSPI